MTDVYLSYSRRDRVLAERLASELGKRGLSVWRDVAIEPGENWREALRAALRSAKRVVLLWTAHGRESISLVQEAGYAGSLGKLMVVAFDGIPLPTNVLHQRYATSASDPEALQHLATLIAVTMKDDHPQEGLPFHQEVEPLEVRNRGFAFLSYAEEDWVFVDELRRFLIEEGFLYWEYSSSDRDVEKLLHLELEDKIRESDVVISVVSPDWKRSVWCSREYFYAKEIGRPVFIAEHRELPPTLAIAGENRLRFWGERRSAGFTLLSRELKRRGL